MSIRHSLLALLTEQPRTPAELRHSFHEATDNFWTLNMGQVTQTLTRLERDGCITPVGSTLTATGHEAVSYAITDEGLAEIAAWWTNPVLRPATERDELVIKVSLAIGRSDVEFLDVLDTQRRAVLAQIQQVHKLLRQTDSSFSAQRLAAERRIFDLESDARFLDRVEAMMKDSSRKGPKP